MKVITQIFFLSLVGVLGCASDTVSNPRPTAEDYWTLRVNHRAVNMALQPPYNVVQLVATPLTATGATVLQANRASFVSPDSVVTVDSITGLATAHFSTAGTPAVVFVSVTAQGITLTDTVFIQVTSTAPSEKLATFSMQPATGDSAKRVLGSGFSWLVNATDVAGTTICSHNGCPLQIFYVSSDPSVAEIDPQTGVVFSHDTGHVVFTATTFAYGVAWQDSVVFRITNMLGFSSVMSLIQKNNRPFLDFYMAPKTNIGVGGVIQFANYAFDPTKTDPLGRHDVQYLVDVIFDKPELVDSSSCGVDGEPTPERGNIAAFGDTSVLDGPLLHQRGPDVYRCRRFPTPGIYHYHSSLFPSDTNEIDVFN